MKQTRWLSEFSCLSEYTRLYPTDVDIQAIDAIINSVN